VYETHVGMAQEEEKVGTFNEFKDKILPRIRDAGYNAIQLMAIAEHPYYASFGYQVSNFFACSSRFGNPNELKALVDKAHGISILVLMDLVDSHAVKNEVEGIARFDGSVHQYFHAGSRGEHPAWDSKCFNYEKPQVLHFLLSNCRYWMDEFNFDGFRFDGVTSMLYTHHDLGKAFTGYADYFDDSVDEAALTYLTLANRLVHQLHDNAITVAEDVSGMPGLAATDANGGTGFDYRYAMGVPDYWIKLVKNTRDEHWSLGSLWYELTNRRNDEKTISYAESHDQALVGDQTLIFRLVGDRIYGHMSVTSEDLAVFRGTSLHKMIRLATLATAGHGYLNFMGNEFGHPEWIDFPREANYLRCHDDIGWTFDDEDARRLGINPQGHRKFLNDFYTGRYPGSFARGVPFQFDQGTGDLRISGTFSSLAGLEEALEKQDNEMIERSVRRINLLRSIQVSIGGIPLLYAGDEYGKLNDYTFLTDPTKVTDSRWVHRSRKRWQAAEDLIHTDTLEWRFFHEMVKLSKLRKQLPQLRNGGMEVVDTGNPHLFGYIRANGGQRLLIINNFSEFDQVIRADRLAAGGLTRDAHEIFTQKTLPIGEDLVFDGYRYMWIDISDQ